MHQFKFLKSLILVVIAITFVCCKSNTNSNDESIDSPPQQQGGPSVSDLFSEMDANNDEKLAKSEVEGPLLDDFAKIDTNKDGFLTKEELENAPRPERRGPRENNTESEDNVQRDFAVTVNVDSSLFIKESLLSEITQEEHTLSNGTKALCYVITTASQPQEHKMGPWCPTHIEDGKDKGGIWFKDDKVYDVDGHFIANLKEFYSDAEWALFREDGSVKVTETQEECEGAAKPDVEEQYHNYCVECLPDYYREKQSTYYIPVKPLYLEKSNALGRDGIGIAFNGVNFEAPAPTHAILAAHTLAPLDDAGGHVNPHAGYHYHAVTGATKEVAQNDAHAPMVGYAMDGFGIYAHKNADGKASTDLDDCNGHYDEVRGYHYHAGSAGSNQVLGCLHGASGSMSVKG
ncbi:YHYH protein [Winogradskyella psychrotolerans]|uniref:YHYH protein n=1 Tax=Winogradskyella psychrotolerans TaxID=1344585 RepID=UPI001C079018|nr:YHYH protein [Winogradskyella psychrotolerans]MBU2929688.1 YHYH protein [Winogradskyella psychrotolerans]